MTLISDNWQNTTKTAQDYALEILLGEIIPLLVITRIPRLRAHLDVLRRNVEKDRQASKPQLVLRFPDGKARKPKSKV